MTQDQWYKKLRSFVPSWVFEREKYSVALFQAVAAVFAGLEKDSADQVAVTFLTGATAPTLDGHGAERSITRLTGEPDAAYVSRIQKITSSTDRASIEALVNSLLLIGPCTILESPQQRPYVSRSTFCSRGSYLIQGSRNYFIIVVPNQTHAPYSFTSRSKFCSRATYTGAISSAPTLLASVIEAVDRTKAFGVMYSVVVKR